MPSASPQTLPSSTVFNWPRMCSAAGVAAFIFLLYCLATMVQISLLGGPPASVDEAFQILQQNKAIGLLRLDFVTVLALPLYYLIFFGLFAALKNVNRTHAAIATALVFIGITLVLAMPTGLPMLALSDQYALATTDSAKAHFLAAGEAVLATDIWHGTGAYMGGLLLQIGAVWISFVMLGGVFSRWTAYVGIFTHGLDALHVVCAPFLPNFAGALMIAAGLGYPVWLVLVGRRLLQLGKAEHFG